MTTRKPKCFQRCFRSLENWAISESAKIVVRGRNEDHALLRLVRSVISPSSAFDTAHANLEYWMKCDAFLQTGCTVARLDYALSRRTQEREYLAVRGWCFDLLSVIKQFSIATPTRRPPLTLYPRPRPDVYQAFPAFRRAYWSGFEIVIPVQILTAGRIPLSYQASDGRVVSFEFSIDRAPGQSTERGLAAQQHKLLVVLGKISPEESVFVSGLLQAVEGEALPYRLVRLGDVNSHDRRLESAILHADCEEVHRSDKFWYTYGGCVEAIVVLGEISAKSLIELASVVLSGVDAPDIFGVASRPYDDEFRAIAKLVVKESFSAGEATALDALRSSLHQTRRRFSHRNKSSDPVK